MQVISKRKGIVVVIDGLSCTCKTTVAQRVAFACNLEYVGVGVIYRAFASYLLTESLETRDIQSLVSRVRNFPLRVVKHGNEFRYWVGETDLTAKMYLMETSILTNHLGTIEPISHLVTEVVKSLVSTKGTVIDGRGVAYHAFPDADLYFLLTATLGERVRRRQLQLASAGSVLRKDIVAEVRKREEHDRQHMKAVLRDIENVRVINTTSKSVDAIVKTVVRIVGSMQNRI